MWLTIESAPRDGTRFLAWSKTAGPVVAWIPNSMAHYKRSEALCGIKKKISSFCPTHWQPLPEPPQ